MVGHKRNREGFTLIEMLIVIVIIGILMALIIPTVMKGMAEAKKATCASNLRELHKAVLLYINKFGGNQKLPPDKTGAALWEQIAKNPSDCLGGNKGYSHDLLVCPILAAPDATSGNYKGPTAKWGATAQETIVGCDRKTNHDGEDKGGNAVRKDALIQMIPESDWAAAEATTAP